jgi:hypothetical protein
MLAFGRREFVGARSVPLVALAACRPQSIALTMLSQLQPLSPSQKNTLVFLDLHSAQASEARLRFAVGPGGGDGGELPGGFGRSSLLVVGRLILDFDRLL